MPAESDRPPRELALVDVEEVAEMLKDFDAYDRHDLEDLFKHFKEGEPDNEVQS